MPTAVSSNVPRYPGPDGTIVARATPEDSSAPWATVNSIPTDWPALGRAVLAAAVTGAAAFLLALLAPRGGLGFGDVKLLGVLGLFLGWLGWGVLVVGVAAGFTLGAVAALAMLASRRAGMRDHLAFGPWLIAGALVGVVAGRPLVDAYLSVGA